MAVVAATFVADQKWLLPSDATSSGSSSTVNDTSVTTCAAISAHHQNQLSLNPPAILVVAVVAPVVVAAPSLSWWGSWSWALSLLAIHKTVGSHAKEARMFFP